MFVGLITCSILSISVRKGEHAFFYAEKVGNQNIIKLLLQEKKDGNKKTLITHQNIKLEALGDVVNVMK